MLQGCKIFDDKRHTVAPLAGAWIETSINALSDAATVVAPLAGAWIETYRAERKRAEIRVAPLAGAWIETRHGTVHGRLRASGRAPRGRVD